MYCPRCAGEFRPEIAACPDCHTPLLPQRPERRAGDRLEPLLRSHSPEEVAGVAHRLRREGIPYVEHNGTALALVEGGSLFGGSRPDVWEGRVWVVASQLEAAEALLETPPAEPSEVVEDWPAAEEGESLADYEARLHRTVEE